MTTLIASICLSGVLFALILSVLSLTLHWTRRVSSPEIAALTTRIQETQTQHLDLLDKVEHWRKRDNVRRARLGAEEKLVSDQEGQAPTNAADYKKALRSKAVAAGFGTG